MNVDLRRPVPIALAWASALPFTIAGLFNPTREVCARRYRNGFVAVNPFASPAGEIQLDRTYLSVEPSGSSVELRIGDGGLASRPGVTLAIE